MKRIAASFLLLILSVTLCSVSSAQERLKMSTTTSTENSGLLKVLLPPFEKQCNCRVEVIAVGTGKAVKIAEAGDVDVVFVHARKLEDKFVADGFGVNRRDVMYNDFVILVRQTTRLASGARRVPPRLSRRSLNITRPSFRAEMNLAPT